MPGLSVSAGSQGSEKSVNALTPIIVIVFRFAAVDLIGQEINSLNFLPLEYSSVSGNEILTLTF